MGALINSIFLLFAGFNPPASSIPAGYKWLYTIVPQRFSISILSALVFCDCPEEPTWNESLSVYENVGSNLGCQPLTGTPITISHTTVKGYTESTFRYNYDDRWANFGYVFVTIAISASCRCCRCATLTTLRDRRNERSKDFSGKPKNKIDRKSVV